MKKIKFYYFLLTLLFSFILLTSSAFKVYANDSLKTLFDKAILLSNQGQYSDARDVWNEYLRLSPDDAPALSNRGNILLALGDPESAIVDQSRAIDLMPEESDPRINRGIAYESLKKWEEAIEDYNWVLSNDPENASAFYNLGNVRNFQEDWINARILFNQAVIKRPGFAMARSSKALVDYQLNELDAAESELRSLIRRYPMFADARAALTALLWRKGFIGEAESNWAAASGLDNRYVDPDWLLNIRRWPPQPTNDLMAFLQLKRP